MVERAKDGKCLCCGGTDLDISPAAVSRFMAVRAFRGKQDLITYLFSCKSCGFKFFRRGLSDKECSDYYKGYHSDGYCKERHSYEIFYTKKVIDNIEQWNKSSQRLKTLLDILKKSGVSDNFESVLDYGGGDGSLIKELTSKEKAVFDVQTNNLKNELRLINNKADLKKNYWHFITCTHVLEHLTDPEDIVTTIFRTLKKGGIAYFEVPFQKWKSIKIFEPPMCFVRFVSHHGRLFTLMDLYSAATKVLLGFLPPMGFLAMREHINFFSEESLEIILRNVGFKILKKGDSNEFFNTNEHKYAAIYALVVK